VVQLVSRGIVGHRQAVDMLLDAGYDHQVAGWLVTEGEITSTGEHRRNTEGQIQRAFTDYLIGDAQAAAMLEALHYSPGGAEFIIRGWKVARDLRMIDAAAALIRSHYVARKISAQDAAGELDAAGVPAEARNKLLRLWGIDRKGNIRQLTPAQIVKAHKLGLFTPPALEGKPAGEKANYDAAHARLTALGYDGGDATLLLAGA
jgi:hypothetical protein